MEIDKEKIIKLIKEVNENVGVIKEFAALPEEEILGNKQELAALKYYFIVSIESLADICLHITAKKFSYAPEGVPDCFNCLKNKGVISEELGRKLIAMGRFRNILIHRYWEIDEKKVVQYAKENVEDFKTFIEQISRYLQLKE